LGQKVNIWDISILNLTFIGQIIILKTGTLFKKNGLSRSWRYKDSPKNSFNNSE